MGCNRLYIDGEFDAIDEALEAKRRLMHLDIANRSARR